MPNKRQLQIIACETKLSTLQVQKWFWDHNENHRSKYDKQCPRDNEGKIYCELDKELEALAQDLNLDIDNQAVKLTTDEDVIEQGKRRGLLLNSLRPKEKDAAPRKQRVQSLISK